MMSALAMGGAGLASPTLLLKLFSGMSTLSMNFAMRHVVQDVSPMQQQLLQSAGFKCVAVFAMFYVSTRDIMLAIILTAVTIVLLRHLLHEHSPLCIIPGCIGGIPRVDPQAPDVASLEEAVLGGGGGGKGSRLITGPAAGGPVTREMYDSALRIVAHWASSH